MMEMKFFHDVSRMLFNIFTVSSIRAQTDPKNIRTVYYIEQKYTLFYRYINATSLTDLWLQELFALFHRHSIANYPVTQVFERLKEAIYTMSVIMNSQN